jgi:2-(1,2-epoxy-1,2-dihydrophenyl)acetyl-CoA isomerase
MATDTPLLFDCTDGIARLRFNRPEVLNAIDIATAQAFRAACESIARDRGVRAVLLSGAGRAFVAGGDLAFMREQPRAAVDQLIQPLHAGLGLIDGIDAPVVASVHGAVAGAGLSLALAADLVIAAEGTRFNLAYVNVGTSCDAGASWALPRVVGLRRALEMALLGETIDATRALEWGLVNRVVPADELQVQTEQLVQRLARGPALAHGHLRRLMRQSFDRPLKTQLAAEAASFGACSVTQDFSEGVGAFLEKRLPRFRGA